MLSQKASFFCFRILNLKQKLLPQFSDNLNWLDMQ